MPWILSSPYANSSLSAGMDFRQGLFERGNGQSQRLGMCIANWKTKLDTASILNGWSPTLFAAFIALAHRRVIQKAVRIYRGLLVSNFQSRVATHPPIGVIRL